MAYNMESLSWQIFFAISMFLSTFVSYLIPIIIFTRRNRRCWFGSGNGPVGDSPEPGHDPVMVMPVERQKHRWKRWLSNCNCLSAGVFIGVCFLNLIPCVEDEFAGLFKDYPELKQLFGSLPVGQFTVILGLFLVLFLENLLSNCFVNQPNNQTKRGDANDLAYPVLFLDEEIVQTTHHDHEQELLLNSDVDQPIDVPVETTNGRNCHDNHPREIVDNQNADADRHNHHHGHGHHHLDVGSMAARTNDSMFSFFLLMFATSVHSLFEGMALGLQTDVKTAIHLFIGIILHECLVSLALGLNAVRLQQDEIRMRTHLKFAFVFSITIPFGSLLGVLLGYTPGHIGRFISAIFQGIAAGTFIHVTFFELIPEEFILLDTTTTTTNHGCDNRIVADSVNQRTAPVTAEQAEPSNQNNLRLKKISLLLAGFLIMAMVPFIFPE